MTCVNQFVWYFQSTWGFFDICKVQLIIDAANKNQPMWGDFEDLISCSLSSDSPVSVFVTASPSWSFKAGSSDLISQVHTNDSGIVAISFGQFSQTFKKLFFRILLIVPESVTIAGPTTPLRFTGMIVEDDHKAGFSDGINRDIKDLHGSFAVQLRIGLDKIVFDDVVAVEHFKRKGQSDGVHVKSLSDLLAHICELSVFEASNTMSFGMSSGPISASDFDSFPSGVDNLHAFGGKGKLYFFDIKKRGFGLEIFL